MTKKIIVIGGGPAGLMAAGRAGELGADVFLLEKNQAPGIKLLITGNGRCNLTNNTENSRELINNLGKNGKFLYSALHHFGVKETLEFFTKRGLQIKVEEENRVFPESDRSHDVLKILLEYLQEGKVKLKTSSQVTSIVVKNEQIEKIILSNGEEIYGDKYIIATGGKSYPATGSNGDAYTWLKQLGHQIRKPIPSLTPVIVKEKIIKNLEGLSLKNVKIGIYKNDKKICAQQGDAIFTSNGISGPLIFNLSKQIGQELPAKLELHIDFYPLLEINDLDLQIQKQLLEDANKILRNTLSRIVPQKLISIIMGMSGIDEKRKANGVNREERKRIVQLLKNFQLEIHSLAGFDKAMVTAGGVALEEVDPKTMQSKIIHNLYLAGEVLDLDGPTGGFNLQIAWTTGHTAGEAATK